MQFITNGPAAVAGIDVSKAWLDVCVAPDGLRRRLAYTDQGLEQLGTLLATAQVQRVVLEATGGLERRAARGLAERGFAVSRVNPDRIWGFRRSMGIQAKTDALDAALIARFAQLMPLPPRPLPSPAEQAIKDLAARRRQLVEMIAGERNRLKQAESQAVAGSIRAVIEALTSARRAVEAGLEAAIAADPDSRTRMQLLCSIPGVGPVVAATLIAELPELGQLDRHRIASLAGVAPHPQQSGTTQNGHRLRGGRPCVRTALYMAALSASRCNARWKAEYQAMLGRGKKPKQALIAIARKIVTLANQMIRNNQPWVEPEPKT